eukprot:Blabericola_migrator_1__3219@NODE_1948_length_3518_cov_491_752246_g72_i2_p1_GENE_NODE_1948_length_3518_cov_491_752246_g72_i2NODE_1948_length_3518_cov_491_752246_g72_i2_p1_ORF_typecomplete_len349_score28_83_NODE_1948_length_3518_cov_491_752246_g72_i217182764
MLLLAGRKSVAGTAYNLTINAQPTNKSIGLSFSDVEGSASNKKVRFVESKRSSVAATFRRISASPNSGHLSHDHRGARVSFTRATAASLSAKWSRTAHDDPSPADSGGLTAGLGSGLGLLSYLTEGSEPVDSLSYVSSDQEDDEYSETLDDEEEDDGFGDSNPEDISSSLESEQVALKFGMGGIPRFGLLNNITSTYQAPKKSHTMFKTDGSPTYGSRARIRQRHAVHSNYGDQTNLDATYIDNDLPLISKDSLLALRRSAWQPIIKTKSNQPCAILDFSVAYNVAWEIGKRGCVAFQKLPRSNLLFLIRKKYGVRFLNMDGTDGMSFLSVYRLRSDQPEPVKCAVFS